MDPDRHPFVTVHDTSRDRWEVFCAEALGPIWAEQPADQTWRHIVATLAISPTTTVVGTLYASCVVHRGRLGDDFVRLQALALEWARSLALMRQREHRLGERPWPPPGGRELIDSFLDGTLAPELVDWGDLAFDVEEAFAEAQDAEAAPTPRPARRRRRAQDVLGIAPEHLAAAFAPLPPLTDAIDEAERERWLRFFQQLSSVLAERLSHGDGDDAYGPRYEWERWALGRLGREGLTAGADAETVWEPLLSLGPAVDDWCEALLQGFVRGGLQQASVPDAMVERWLELLEYVSAQEQWKKPGYNNSSVLALLGIDSFTHRYWRPEHAQLLAAVQPAWGEWLTMHLGAATTIEHFSRFAELEAASGVLEDGLVWLDQTQAQHSSGQRQSDVDEALGQLLAHVYGARPDIMRGNSAAGEAARRLLVQLSARQLRIAMEISARLAGV